MGRPRLLPPPNAIEIIKGCSKIGDLAEAFGVSTITVYRWRGEYPEIENACRSINAGPWGRYDEDREPTGPVRGLGPDIKDYPMFSTCGHGYSIDDRYRTHLTQQEIEEIFS